jgi:hypothetical protein
VASQPNDKVDVSRVLIHSVDGAGSSARVTSIEAANSVLKSWAHDQSGALPAECEVEILFEDGLRYCSLYQLKEQEKGVSLSRHVRRQLAVLTKTQHVKRIGQPANDSSIVCPDQRSMAECARAMLEHYNI